ncbi:DUF4252 domain-containing protein [Flavobacterium quisquiliarum]|uniref:DUF4252 domain-containing protein n=1 Tax=Flavobacterium quisquiliarum TaxID=1834436 RepID=A0ABV8WC61_9FLAO|nr:DUF4252 domain-containing protein [Flavobacterium quisquiliarum]MBW1658757.1 DUF4252 domain-containing protein [Flavobacterium quisquiliarum]NWL03488.1 DUF4252 domain-containing protein [Flavobacterium collinsii]
MKATVFTSTLFFLLLLVSCNSEPSLQKYFVENSEKKDFIALDVSPNILNVDKTKLSTEQNEALNSFDKMNILAFKADPNNQVQFEAERNKVKAILKDPKYQELMKIGSGKDGASVSYVGNDDNIKEFVIFANRKENGFAVVRVLGENMNPNNIMTLMSVLQKSKIDMEQLKPLQQLIKK